MSQPAPVGPAPQQAKEGEATNSPEASPQLELEPDFDFAVDDSLMGDLEYKQ